MGTKIDWDAVLPGEVDWDAVLPNHQWKRRGATSWEHVRPPPRKQLEILPKDFGGSCAVHSFSESLTGLLRIGLHPSSIEVDLPRLLHLSAAKGILTEEGSALSWIDLLAKSYGIPLDGKIAERHIGREQFGLGQLDADADIYALNTCIFSLPSQPMPFGKCSRTPEAALQAIHIQYRESLCDLLDMGPLVICLDIDDRYSKPRQVGQPYCRVPDSWLSFGEPPKTGHCISAYGYRCPGGDVRTLRVLYQENDTNAPDEEPGRLLIHPDAIDSYHLVRLRDLQFSNTPSPGYKDVELHHAREKRSWWKKTIDSIF